MALKIHSDIVNYMGNPIHFEVAEVDCGPGIGIDSVDIVITGPTSTSSNNLTFDEVRELHRILGLYLAAVDQNPY